MKSQIITEKRDLGLGWWSGTREELIARVDQVIATIPASYQASAVIHLSGRGAVWKPRACGLCRL